jgi:O-antigen/teichoic acid export membrane protein
VVTRDPHGKAALDDRRRLVRGALLNAVAAAANGVLSFVLVVVITRGLSQGNAGVFLEAVALFAILSTVAELGADDAILRMIPRHRALGRPAVRGGRLLAVALGPVLGIAVVGGALTAGLAGPLSRALVHGSRLDPEAMVPFLRVLAPFLPLSAALTVVLAATRGFETMVPNAILGNVLRPGLRVALVFGAVSAGLGSVAIALSWGLPIGVALIVAAAWFASLIRQASDGGRGPRQPHEEAGSLAGEFWRFAAPRALSSAFGVTVTWLDTLLVAVFLTSRDAAVYAAAGRLLMVGLLALGPVQLVLAPMMSRLLASGERARAQAAYRTATEWVMLASWPLYASLAVFAPFVLRVFGSGYPAGQTVLLILSIAGMANMATGPCLTVLLMGGRSGWTLAIAAGALTFNVGLNLLLIPHLGIVGAALTWGIGIALTNAAGLILVRRLMGLSPFGRGAAVIAAAAVLCFGGLGLMVRSSLGMTLPSVALAEIAGTIAYAALLWRSREWLHLPERSRSPQDRARLAT